MQKAFLFFIFTSAITVHANLEVDLAPESQITTTLKQYHNGLDILERTKFVNMSDKGASEHEVLALFEKLSQDHNRGDCQILNLDKPATDVIEAVTRSQGAVALVRVDTNPRFESSHVVLETGEAIGFLEHAPFAFARRELAREITNQQYHAVRLRILRYPPGSSIHSVYAGAQYQDLKLYYGETTRGPLLLSLDMQTFEAENTLSSLFPSASFRRIEAASGSCAVYPPESHAGR